MEPTPTTLSHARRRSGSHPRGARDGASTKIVDNSHTKSSSEGTACREDRGGSDISGTSEDWEMDDIRSDNELTDDEETGLTDTQRKHRRRRKSQNQYLDERVAPSGHLEDIREAQGRIAKASMLKDLLINVLLIALWYCFSISISVYNKWMFSPGNLDFHFPLFTTSLHMLVQFSMASLVLFIFPRFRPGRAKLTDDAHGSYSRIGDDDSDQPPPHPTDPEQKSTRKALMTQSFYLTRIAPCGTATALDIGLGNFSLRFISLTFFTMCKSSVLAFVLVFAFLFHLEKPTWKLCAIIALMTVGVIMMVAGEAAFNALGFTLVMTASFCSGFRWSLTQILLLRNAATSNPFSSIFFLTPSMFLVLFLLALPIEGPHAVLVAFADLCAQKGTLFSIVIMLFPGILAFLMVAAEFALIKRTSVVTLSVCGIFKEVLTISAASLVFGDPLSPVNVSGVAVTILSIAGYNWLKYAKMRSMAKKEAREVMDDTGMSVGKVGGERRDLDEGAFAIGRDSTGTVGETHGSATWGTEVEPGGGSDTGRGAGHVMTLPSGQKL